MASQMLGIVCVCSKAYHDHYKHHSLPSLPIQPIQPVSSFYHDCKFALQFRVFFDPKHCKQRFARTNLSPLVPIQTNTCQLPYIYLSTPATTDPSSSYPDQHMHSLPAYSHIYLSTPARTDLSHPMPIQTNQFPLRPAYQHIYLSTPARTNLSPSRATHAHSDLPTNIFTYPYHPGPI